MHKTDKRHSAVVGHRQALVTVIYGQMPDHAYSEVSDVNKAIDSNVYVKATDYTPASAKFQNFP